MTCKEAIQKLHEAIAATEQTDSFSYIVFLNEDYDTKVETRMFGGPLGILYMGDSFNDAGEAADFVWRLSQKLPKELRLHLEMDDFAWIWTNK